MNILTSKIKKSSSRIEVFVVPQPDQSSWDAELESFRYSIFQTWVWLEAVANENHTPIYLNFKENGVTVAKMAGMVYRSNDIRRGTQLYFYSSPAFMNYTPSLGINCLTSLRSWAQKHHYSRITIAARDNQESFNEEVPGFYDTKNFEQVIFLKSHHDYIANLDNRKRNKLKNAAKIGAIIKETTSEEDLSKLLQLMENTRSKRLEKYDDKYNSFYLRNLSIDSLKKLLKTGMAVIHSVELDQKTTLAMLNLKHKDKTYGLLKGSDEMAYKNSLHLYLDASIIQQYTDQGMSYLNTSGGSLTDRIPGVEAYKQSLGACEVITSSYSTNFLTFPQQLLNPIISLIRKFPNFEYRIYKRVQKWI